HYLNNSPALARGQRTRLDYSHDIANVSANFVVRHELGAASNVAFVFSVSDLSFDPNDHGLLHLVARHQPDLFLASMPGRGSRSGKRLAWCFGRRLPRHFFGVF